MNAASDAITAEVVSRHLHTTSHEMSAALMRAAFSPNIKERGDCSTAVFDRRGDVIAQAHQVPIHLGSMLGAVEHVIARHEVAGMRPGDMFLANDPYNGGGSHLPDLNLVAPVFFGDDLVAFVANIAHHADVGGMVAGSESSTSTSIFQEGLRIPPVRFVRAGTVVQDVLEIVLSNTRTPVERRGDLWAQVAANNVGTAAVQQLFARYGIETAAIVDAFLSFTAARFARAIGRCSSGTYRVSDALDGATPDEHVPIELELTVEADAGRLHFDFTGTARQLPTGRNMPLNAVWATVTTVAKSLLDPGVPANAGVFRTIRITAPEATVVNPSPPAPVGARALSCAVLGDVVAAALSEARHEEALAPSGPHHQLSLSGIDPRDGSYFVDYETIAGGMGARTTRAGMDAVRVHASGAGNLPVEALEKAFPLRVERYALRDESGGRGTHRGGNGVIREYRVLADQATVSLSSERQHVVARGLDGGRPGAPGRFVLDPGTAGERVLPGSVHELHLQHGALLRVETPGGGGYGPVPPEEEPQQNEDRAARDRSHGGTT